MLLGEVLCILQQVCVCVFVFRVSVSRYAFGHVLFTSRSAADLGHLLPASNMLFVRSRNPAPIFTRSPYDGCRHSVVCHLNL